MHPVAELKPLNNFSVDGTLIQAWAGHKSFVPKTKSNDDSTPGDGGGSQKNWRGEKRSNAFASCKDKRFTPSSFARQWEKCHLESLPVAIA